MTIEQDRWTSARRRDFIKTVATVAPVPFAGCSENVNHHSPQGGVSTNSQSQLPKDIRVAQEKIEIAYRELEDHPLVENDRFVFDVASFQSEFDRQRTLDNAQTAQRLLEEIEKPPEIPGRILSNLKTTAVVAELQMKQRVQAFRTIQTGSMYLELLGDMDFGTATKVIVKARTFLADVASFGESLEVQLEPIESDLVKGYDYKQFQRAQKISAQVVVWLGPIYRGAQHFARAMDQIQLASRELKSDDFGNASERYEEANEYLLLTQNEFNKVYGRGRTLPRFEQFVVDLRCMLPIHIRFTEGLADASDKVENGNETQARKILRETLSRYYLQSEGCTGRNSK